MNKRSLAALIAVVLVTTLFGIFSFKGASLGLYVIKPMYTGIKQGLDLTGGVSAVYQIKNDADKTPENLAAAEAVFRTRLDDEGYTEATLTPQGNDKIRIEIPINQSTGNVDPNEVTKYLVSTAKVTFEAPQGTVLFEGKDMVEVGVSQTSTGQPAVGFKLNDQATKVFAEKTAELNGKNEPIYVMLDGTVISAPTVSNGAITGGSGIIEGSFTYESASRLANQIRSGVMPVEMQEIEVRSISATLGEEALQLGIKAGVIGLILVMIFMLVMYKLPGLVADIALTIYILLVLFAMATIDGIQLTLPGIAGIILAIGMAVDANVIIFERVTEEVLSGKTLRTASQAGFARAFTAILDSNVTTVIAAVVLLYFGTGTIKGFAITLLIGIIASFITAVFISRGLMSLMISINGNPALYKRTGAKAIKREAK